MLTIYKYPLKEHEHQILKLPLGSQVLDAQYQRGQLTLWALVDTGDVETEEHEITMLMTGQDIGSVDPGMHLATLQDRVGLVYHLFHKEPW